MDKVIILQQIEKKGSDKEKIAGLVVRNTSYIPHLLEGLQAQKGSIKFGCEKVLRLVSREKPEVLYPYFDIFVKLLGSDNNFLKWGAIITIANLTTVDSKKKFERSKYPKISSRQI